MYEYKALIYKVSDGDTFHAEVDLGLKVYTKCKFRLKNIDTPEMYSGYSCQAERKHGLEAKAFVEDLILDKEVSIHTYKDKAGKYGRWIAEVYLEQDGATVSLSYLLEMAGFKKKTPQEYLTME